ncbi:hypothetical protein Ais01nite_74550 [Asanoa ishikariensis]|uniref:Uncharacterized protein n=1 Tax=Asanoa ishikariensis TaxID=137265 RepID=A0A1H3USA2_9ACTN|nr:hypothetical protein Ais01nite_74550 [Asanoa ishikariensis]SDZ65272.1 hypothetical protein SAMN05421684_7979 [Asanoa ishikariensis]
MTRSLTVALRQRDASGQATAVGAGTAEVLRVPTAEDAPAKIGAEGAHCRLLATTGAPKDAFREAEVGFEARSRKRIASTSKRT